jgi:cation diffusion facilitator family transporter
MPTTHTHDLYRQGRRAALLGCATGLLLGLAKLIGGWAGHSVALVADAVHSLGDALLSGAVWLVFHWAERPADPEHPYGHARAEAVAGSSIALILVLSAGLAGWQAVRAFTDPHPEPPSAFTLGIAAVSFVVNEGLYRYSRRVARRTGSAALAATAWDQRLDALTAAGILVALATARFGGPGWGWTDHAAGLGVAAIILWAGGRLFRDSVNELMDAQAGPAVVRAVRREAAATVGVVAVEKLRVRKTGLEFLVDIHIEVDPAATVREGHAIAHAVKDRVMDRVAAVRDVLVHIEPAADVRSPHLDGSHRVKSGHGSGSRPAATLTCASLEFTSRPECAGAWVL